MILNFKLFSRLYYFILLLVGLIGIGTAGYYFIEGWKVIDAFYMTIITISTVGFSEVHELSLNGKIFTSILIISSFGTFAFAIRSITTYLVGGEYKKYVKEHKISKKLNQMKNHVIICGFGRVGKQVAEDLKSHGDYFIVVENDESVISEFESDNQIEFLKGNSTDDETLIKANVKSAKAIICCLPKDAENLYVVLAAREMNPEILIITRSSNNSAVSKLKLAGANNVIMPDAIGGSHMASLVANPDVMEFLDIIRVQGNKGANMESISYEELPEEYRNKTIGELESKKITGVTIIGYKDKDGEYIINPSMDIKVVSGSKIFLLGNSHQISHLHKHFGIYH